MELFLDKEEKSIEDERSFEESSVEKTEEKPKGDGNNTATQKKLDLDINMIRAREKNTGKNQK